MYVDNFDNYIRKDTRIDKIFENMTSNANNIIERIDHMKRKKFTAKTEQLPYGYIIPKNKDKNKYRPVVSYFHHKYKKLLNTTSRGIAGMLKLISKNSKNCVLWKTGDLHNVMIEKIRKLLELKNSKNKYIKVRSYDIKNFYTNLDHSEIRKAFKWLVSTVKKHKRVCEYVSVSSDRNEKNRIGSKVNMHGWTDLDMDVLQDIIDMDLNYAIFTIGDVILQQEKGVPMGSPLSPILAILVAAFYEYQFFESCRQEEKDEIDGVRYVDDISIIAVCDRNVPGDEERIDLLMDKFEKCYHEDLILERTPIDDGDEWIFLAGNLKIDCFGRLDMSSKNVNWKHVLNERNQKIVRFVHWFSYNSKQVKRAVICGAVHRIIVNSSCVYNMIEAMFKLFMELRILKYPWSVICSVIVSCKRKKGHLSLLWNQIETLIEWCR